MMLKLNARMFSWFISPRHRRFRLSFGIIFLFLVALSAGYLFSDTSAAVGWGIVSKKRSCEPVLLPDLESNPQFHSSPGDAESSGYVTYSKNYQDGANLSTYAAFGKFSISPQECSITAPPFLVLIVFIRVDAFVRRAIIRRTFGSLANYGKQTDSCEGVSKESSEQGDPQGVRLLFILGLTEDHDIQVKLEDEAHLFGDIIQSEAFYDTYRQAARKGRHVSLHPQPSPKPGGSLRMVHS